MNKHITTLSGLAVLLIGLIWAVANLFSLSFPLLFNLSFGLIVFAGYFYLTVMQFAQALRPKDNLTGLRILMSILLVVNIITFLPSLAYQFVRITGEESEVLRALVSISSRVNSMCTLVLLVAIVKYKIDSK